MLDPAIAAFATLIVVVDPVGNAALFVVLTAGQGTAERRRVALRALAVAMGVLTAFALAGEAVLSAVGISLPAFRIAGGILLFLTALDMLFETRTQRRERRVESERGQPAAADPSVFPLAIPLIAGPGTITALILLVGERPGELGWQAAVLGVLTAVMALQFLLFRLGDPIERALGRTGVLVVTRLMGMLLSALAVQFVLDGFADLGVLSTG